jgi:WD repeat and SOF domain-containing protein 1
MSLSAPLLPVRPMLDIATISRNPADYTRDRIGDITARHHSLNPSLHPYAQQREYTRALNAVKYERLFAKPFLYSLDGHRDGVCSLSRVRHQLSWLASGGCDGELKLWSLAQRRCEWSAKAHDGFVRSVCSDDTGQRVFTCSTDMTVKMWEVDQDKRRRDLDAASSPAASSSSSSSLLSSASSAAVTPTSTYLHPHAVNCMDHHHAEPMFAAASSVVSLYNPLRPDPIHSFSWGADSINCVSFSPVEHHLLLSASSDRCVLLYDTRQRTAAKKILLLMQTNAIALSPLDAFYFLTASEDHNVYAFDLRRLDHAVCIHKVRRRIELPSRSVAAPCLMGSL